jgi:hypothetical protein
MLARLACHGLWLARGLVLGSLLGASPAVGCEAISLEAPDEARQYSFEGVRMLPFLVLWQAHRSGPLPARPDRVRIVAVPDEPLLLSYEHEGCLIGFLPVAQAEVWAALRRLVGTVA